MGEVTCAVFNISRLNKSRQYFKIVDEKNNVTFNISEQFKSFQSLQEKISSNEMENYVKLWIRDSRFIGAAQQEEWKGNSVKKSDIMNWRTLAYMVVEISSHVEKKQEKPR